MPRIKQKTKAEDLTRVRNNQRRCRQRKRDYVADLERRLASMEATTSREIKRLQSTVDELQQVNERLIALLYSRRTDYGSIGFIEQTQSENDSLRDISSDLVPFGDASLLGTAENITPEDISQLDIYPPPYAPLGKFKDFLQESSCLSISPEVEPDPESLLLPEQNVINTTISTEVSKDEYQDTTVCAVALELVMNCNTKNLSISELDMRLRCGYRSARFQWEGCRVDNQVLFAVLAEVMK
ncbi:hypothetical protein ANOM_005285 [Aspergillus nomiae NRRL 13137]|uniref:BZIP domain-containing protein n=1 Tax=Aspergillus nomiae NRRL (strain ATCC 15546 / NRRL 13137 / CBS 260.88 / M93) TaxID=1509407 RepID=A0A0L1J5S7_ASPN3|nr:uncharacterized protein ANOM_005285 [Aspergillus nomiae NRRL 13137]KNG87092.1 hypothetical protein ANOM_005285 [Aspergillus nomiae NRRL 13137]